MRGGTHTKKIIHKNNMTQEDKQLLLKDLCMRLPYDVNGVFTKGGVKLPYDSVLTSFYYGEIEMTFNGYRSIDNRVEFTPYLRPMSSMTPHERFEYDELNHFYTKGLTFNVDEIDWLIAHHFDYRGLIEKGLALEAPNDMYKTE